MRIGAHVDSTDPLAAAADRGAEVVQFFLTDPQGYAAPAPRADAEALRAADVDVYIHAPYLVNVATSNNRIRIPSRKLLMQHAQGAIALGARGLIVHGGHVGKGGDLDVGFENWRKTFAYAHDNGGFGLPILIENTAGGDNACARRFDALARLWDVVGDFGAGFCLDTCHAHAGGEELLASSTGSRRSPGGSTWSMPTIRATSSTPAPIGTTTSGTDRSTPSSSSRSCRRPARRRWWRHRPRDRPRTSHCSGPGSTRDTRRRAPTRGSEGMTRDPTATDSGSLGARSVEAGPIDVAPTAVLSARPDGTSTKEQKARAPADWGHFAPPPPRPRSGSVPAQLPYAGCSGTSGPWSSWPG